VAEIGETALLSRRSRFFEKVEASKIFSSIESPTNQRNHVSHHHLHAGKAARHLGKLKRGIEKIARPVDNDRDAQAVCFFEQGINQKCEPPPRSPCIARPTSTCSVASKAFISPTTPPARMTRIRSARPKTSGSSDETRTTQPSSLFEPGPVRNPRVAVAPSGLAPRVAAIDGGYERLHSESIEQSCSIEGQYQLGTAPTGSPAPLHALAIEPQKDEAIQLGAQILRDLGWTSPRLCAESPRALWF
jgi:hypothetical protein